MRLPNITLQRAGARVARSRPLSVAVRRRTMQTGAAASAEGSMYAVAIRDHEDLRLVCRIRRSPGRDVYVLFPRDEPGWDPHASYHRDGVRHVRAHGGRYLVDQRQRPDESFRGAESVFALALQPGEVPRLKTPCRTDRFSEVFEIAGENFPPEEHHTLVVDLVEPGHGALAGPWREVVAQRSFRDNVPWILVTLWRGLRF